MYFHSQNLNELPGKRYGAMWRDGRCWLHLSERALINVEWRLLKWSNPRMQVGLGYYGDTAVGVSIDIGIAMLHISFDHWRSSQAIRQLIKRKDERYGNGRTIGISFHGGGMWVDLWNDPMESRGRDPKWWHFSFHPANFFLGRSRCTIEALEERDVSVPMPEKAYPAHAKLMLYTWKRPRWFAKRMKRVEIDIPEGIPFPGKGTMAYNCGPDATFGMTTGECHSIAEGIGKLVGSVLDDRIRYGGWSSFTYEKR